MNEFPTNPLRRQLARGESVRIAGTAIGNALATEIMASMGFDAVAISGHQYFEAAATDVLPIAMIETVAGVNAAEEIMSVPGLGGIFVGTSDPSAELGLECTPDVENPLLRKHMGHIFELGRKLGVPTGAYAPTLDGTRLLHEMGA